MTQVTRMLLVDTEYDRVLESEVGSLPSLLGARDLLVVNDAATIPASLHARLGDGSELELRLLDAPYGLQTRAVLFGRGDYRVKTEERELPPPLAVGTELLLGGERLTVAAVSSLSPRLVELAWPAELAARFALLYRAGRPVQYSYMERPLSLWDVQTSFASRPWAVEMPSAARPLSGELLLALRARGVQIASLTHAAGLSATGDAAIDAALPLPERYQLPQQTIDLIAQTRARGGRVVAVGTSVVRALEDNAARFAALRAGEYIATLVLDAESEPRVADGLLTGVHMPGESHYRLLSAFTLAETLRAASELARVRGYRLHEFGDAALLLPNIARPLRAVA